MCLLNECFPPRPRKCPVHYLANEAHFQVCARMDFPYDVIFPESPRPHLLFPSYSVLGERGFEGAERDVVRCSHGVHSLREGALRGAATATQVQNVQWSYTVGSFSPRPKGGGEIRGRHPEAPGVRRFGPPTGGTNQ